MGRWKELLKKYGKVAVGVHLSVSTATIGLYIAIKNNVDVEALIQKVGLSSGAKDKDSALAIAAPTGDRDTAAVILDGYEHGEPQQQPKHKNKTVELAASSGGPLALALLCNKALFPIRAPITVALTPPAYRFLARRNLLKTQV